MALNAKVTRLLIVVETQLLFVMDMRPLVVVETRLLRRKGTQLSTRGDHVRCFEARTQAPLGMHVWL